jgi:hypothetical protein
MPPIASISLTKCPFAEPPIDGLQDNTPIVVSDIVMSAVEQFINAEALAASIPACPPPITIISYEFIGFT